VARPRRDPEYVAVSRLLTQNRRKREEAAARLDAARGELAALFNRGLDAGISIVEMARLAGISRETAHRMLRDR
jgi:transcriptional regulator of acetoin/glycerol metabolism